MIFKPVNVSESRCEFRLFLVDREKIPGDGAGLNCNVCLGPVGVNPNCCCANDFQVVLPSINFSIDKPVGSETVSFDTPDFTAPAFYRYIADSSGIQCFWPLTNIWMNPNPPHVFGWDGFSGLAHISIFGSILSNFLPISNLTLTLATSLFVEFADLSSIYVSCSAEYTSGETYSCTGGNYSLSSVVNGWNNTGSFPYSNTTGITVGWPSTLVVNGIPPDSGSLTTNQCGGR